MEKDTKAGEQNKSIIEEGGKRREKGDRGRESWKDQSEEGAEIRRVELSS